MIREDKIIHFFTFGALAFILALTVDPMKVIILILIFSVVKEVFDVAFKKTMFDLYDIVANIWGAMVALCLYRFIGASGSIIETLAELVLLLRTPF